MAESKYISYRGTVAMNRDLFFLNYRDFVGTYETLYTGLEVLMKGLGGRRDVDGRNYVSFIPFFGLMQRQSLAGFDHLASHQAYQAWMMVRPAIEIPLFMGKWTDNPAAEGIWMHREKDPPAYQKEYSSKKMSSAALPGCDKIRAVLKTINDQFVHPNPYYYHRHLHRTEIDNGGVLIEVEYFDEQNILEAHVLAFLHLLAVVHDSVRQMLTDRVGDFPGSSEILPRVETGFQNRVDILAGNDPISKDILRGLGCWPVNAT